MKANEAYFISLGKWVLEKGTKWDGKGAKHILNNKRQEVVEMHDGQHSERTWHKEKERKINNILIFEELFGGRKFQKGWSLLKWM